MVGVHEQVLLVDQPGDEQAVTLHIVLPPLLSNAGDLYCTNILRSKFFVQPGNAKCSWIKADLIA